MKKTSPLAKHVGPRHTGKPTAAGHSPLAQHVPSPPTAPTPASPVGDAARNSFQNAAPTKTSGPPVKGIRPAAKP